MVVTSMWTGAEVALVPLLSVAVIVGNVSHAIHDYNAIFGANPVGTNPEITRALNGNNPKHINFINAEAGMRVVVVASTEVPVAFSKSTMVFGSPWKRAMPAAIAASSLKRRSP